MRTLATKQTAINQYNGFGNQLWDIAGTRPSLDQQFADRKDLVDVISGQQLITHTRASSGTYVGSDGLIKTAVTNLLTYSEDFSNAAWDTLTSATKVSATGVDDPAGGTTASTWKNDGTTPADGGIRRTISGTSGLTYTYSIWIRRRTGTGDITMTVGQNVSFDVTSQVTSEWNRISVTNTADANTRGYIFIRTPGDEIDIWGAQLEQSSTVGEYIPTTSTINSAPRFDHDPVTGESLGLLVEESRTNLVPYSSDFSSTNYSASGSTLISDSATAPDGTTTADFLREDSSNGRHDFFNSSLISLTAAAHTFSFFAKANGRTWIKARFDASGVFGGVFFNLSGAGSVGTADANYSGSIQQFPNGWYRCSVSFTTTATSYIAAARLATADGTDSYQGDGTSGIYIWGAQLEAGSFPTSYIPTTTATVTRAADVASISGSNFNTSQFSRASTATFYNSSGIITTANVDIPRNNYNPTTLVAEGLLLEPQRSNIVLQSNGFDTTWTNANSTETASAGTSPDGTNNAWELTDTLDGSAVQHNLVQSGINYEAGKLYTASLHVKAGTLPRVAVIIAGNAMSAGNRAFGFDMTTETFTFSANAISGPSFTKLPNSWYRISMTYTADATDAANLTIRPVAAAGNVPGLYQGDGTGTILIYGAQIEEGPDATSYIPTTTTEVTRSADVPAVSPWYRQDEGTVFAEINRNTSISRNLRVFSVTDGTTNNRIFDLRQDTSSLGYAFSVASGVIEVLQSVEFNSGSQNNKVAISQSLNNFGVSINGGSVLADTSVTMPIVNQISIGSLNGASQFAGAIRRLVYWDQRLPNDTLETITQ